MVSSANGSASACHLLKDCKAIFDFVDPIVAAINGDHALQCRPSVPVLDPSDCRRCFSIGVGLCRGIVGPGSTGKLSLVIDMHGARHTVLLEIAEMRP